MIVAHVPHVKFINPLNKPVDLVIEAKRKLFFQKIITVVIGHIQRSYMYTFPHVPAHVPWNFGSYLYYLQKSNTFTHVLICFKKVLYMWKCEKCRNVWKGVLFYIVLNVLIT